MAEARPQGKTRNLTRMANHIVSNVEVKIIGRGDFTELRNNQQGKVHAQFEDEEPEEEDYGDKISFAQVAFYQVDQNSYKEDSDDDCDKSKTLNPYYLYLDSCYN